MARKSEQEKFYDNEIAPKLLILAKQCKAKGLSFVAQVSRDTAEKGDDFIGVTAVSGNGGVARWLAVTAADSRGNIDTLLTALCRKAREVGHSSVYLRSLEIPEKPEKE